MYFTSNLFSRIKDLARRRAHTAGRVSRQWFFIVCFTTLSLAGALGYAMYRFNYWSDFEGRTADHTPAVAPYDQEALETILLEFAERSARREEITTNTPLRGTSSVPF